MVQARYSNLWGDRRFSPETEYGVCTEAQVQENSSLITFRITQAPPILASRCTVNCPRTGLVKRHNVSKSMTSGMGRSSLASAS